MQSRWKRSTSVRCLCFLLSPNAPPPFTRAASGLADIVSSHNKSEKPPVDNDGQSEVSIFAELARRRPSKPYPKPPLPGPPPQASPIRGRPPASPQLPPRPAPRAPPAWYDRNRFDRLPTAEAYPYGSSNGTNGLNSATGIYDNRWMRLLQKTPLHRTNGTKKYNPIVAKPIKNRKKQQKIVTISEETTTKTLAQKLGVGVSQVERILTSLGEVPQSPEDPLSLDAAELAAMEFDVVVQKTRTQRMTVGETVARPAVVTVMGHVDHGKTTLLDTLRHTTVAAKEAGGITQHIGAFEVRLTKSGETLTFLDTPGHAAFSSMRARGAQVTDLVVLVVAADDGVMPQTQESLKFIREAKCPFVVAVTKCDLPQANIAMVREKLTLESVELEEVGGNVQLVEVSATQGIGLDDLQEALILQATNVDLRSRLDAPATAVVVEANKSRGLGPTATVIITDGTLKTGDAVVVGHHWGRIKQMKTSDGATVDAVTPGRPVELSGLRTVPQPGDLLEVVRDEDRAKRVSAARMQRHYLLKMAEKKTDNEEEQRTVPFLIKTDTRGTGEAVDKAIGNLASDVIAPEIMSCTVGDITEADIEFAKSTGARILAFNTKPQGHDIVRLAREKQVEIHRQDLIHKLLDDVGAVLLKSAAECEDEEITGEALVKKIFTIKTKRSKAGLSVAGCHVQTGNIQKSAPLFRVVREERVVFEGGCASLKIEKTDVDRVGSGMDCGIALNAFQCQEDDRILAILKKRRPPKTESVIGGGLRVVEFTNV